MALTFTPSTPSEDEEDDGSWGEWAAQSMIPLKVVVKRSETGEFKPILVFHPKSGILPLCVYTPTQCTSAHSARCAAYAYISARAVR